MRNRVHLFGLLFICIMARQIVAQTRLESQETPLCELQTQVAQGERRSVLVKGLYLSGIEGQYLVTSECSGRSTYIEFALKSHRLWKRLVQLSNKTNKRMHRAGDGDTVLVAFEGEFYGPRAPDTGLPESFRKNYHPAWGSYNNSMTKMVVYTIRSVEPLPANHPCAPPKSKPGQWPCFQNPAPVSPSEGAVISHEAEHAQGRECVDSHCPVRSPWISIPGTQGVLSTAEGKSPWIPYPVRPLFQLSNQ
jgi:hypothetical protein